MRNGTHDDERYVFVAVSPGRTSQTARHLQPEGRGWVVNWKCVTIWAYNDVYYLFPFFFPQTLFPPEDIIRSCALEQRFR